jgi:hypothetical protein
MLIGLIYESAIAVSVMCAASGTGRHTWCGPRSGTVGIDSCYVNGPMGHSSRLTEAAPMGLLTKFTGTAPGHRAAEAS